MVDDYDAVLVYREAALVGPGWWSGSRLAASRSSTSWTTLSTSPIAARSAGASHTSSSSARSAGSAAMSKVVIVNSSFHREYVSASTQRVADPERRRRGRCTARAARRSANGRGMRRLVGKRDHGGKPGADRGGRCEKLLSARTSKSSSSASSDTPFPDLDDGPPMARGDRGRRPADARHRPAPAPITEWNKRKFFMKVVQYMALGIPPVCSRSGRTPRSLTTAVGLLGRYTGRMGARD